MIEIVLIIIIILLLIDKYNKAGFNQPDKNRLYDDIIKNAGLFKTGGYANLKSVMPNLDAGIYNDVRHLIRQNTPLNKDTLSIIFRSDVL